MVPYLFFTNSSRTMLAKSTKKSVDWSRNLRGHKHVTIYKNVINLIVSGNCPFRFFFNEQKQIPPPHPPQVPAYMYWSSVTTSPCHLELK